ncbi:MAG TPA: hydrogenase formation protein HypD [Desulfobulbus sp.]|nr:hydrogenase formation protein HypD [Desulfobulbus sp.]
MKCASEFRARGITDALLRELAATVDRPLRIMEVCGTHTVSIFRSGLRSLVPEKLELISGPGCPVCVTPAGHVDAFVQAARKEDVIVATFGDLIRVPGSDGSLAEAGSEGATVEVVYSPMDALALAQNNPEKTIFFPAVGFETTAPTIAATILEANRLKIENFCIFAGCKIMPPPLVALMSDPMLNVDGLLCPGHVSAIIGADAYKPLAEKYHLPCAVAGFEPADIVAGLISLARQVVAGQARVENCYTRVVSDEGNSRARELMYTVFTEEDTQWRGLGLIAGSGLGLRRKFARFDAINKLQLDLKPVPEPKGCRCGEILQGHLLPPACPLYGRTCTPSRPIGPCMVSSEGTCAAYYRFSGDKHSVY